LIEAYNRELFKMDILDGVARRIPTVEKERKFELIEGYNLTEIEAPISFVGKTLRELEVRKRYGIEIILIKRFPAGATAKPGTSETEKLIEFIPDPDNRIQPGDSFLVVGQSKNIERLRYI